MVKGADRVGRKLNAVTIGAGGLVTAVTTAVLCLSLWGRWMPGQLLVAVMTAGLTVLVIGLISRFEKQLCLWWFSPMETQPQNRWQCPRPPEATSHQPAKGYANRR